MTDRAAFVVEFASGAERDVFMAAAGGLRTLLGDITVEPIGLRGGRRGKFAATIALPIALGVAGNLATDAIREVARVAWEEILHCAHDVHAPPIRAQLCDPPELIETELPLVPDPHRRRGRGQR
jgi:hypothetical protein